jgi:hypothetical protein
MRCCDRLETCSPNDVSQPRMQQETSVVSLKLTTRGACWAITDTVAISTHLRKVFPVEFDMLAY